MANDDIVAALRAWAPLVASGYTVTAAGQVMESAATALAERDATIERLEERCAAYKGQVEAGAAEIERLETENEELRTAPWPEWATKVLAVIRSHSGYDGHDDALDGVDLPAELEELMSELEHEARRHTAEARADREVEQHKASTDHYRLQANEQRTRANAAERERDEARAEVERLKSLVSHAQDIFMHCNVEDGVCCCGDEMRNHADPMSCGHSPVDHGGYVADQWIKEARAALTAKGGENEG